MSHKKCYYGLSALMLAVSGAYAAPPGGPFSKGGDDPPASSGTPGFLLNFTPVFCTGFEAVDGWDLDAMFCGAEFTACTIPVTDACVPKDHVGNENCCVNDPNVDTGWYGPDNFKHCQEPSIRNIHPSTLKDPASTQHLRFQFEAGLPGTPTNPLCQGRGSACRQRIASPVERPQADVTKRTYKYDIAFSQVPAAGNASLISGFIGIHLHPYIFLDVYMYAYYNGYVYAYVPSDGFAVRHTIGRWDYDSPDYGQITVTLDPCNNTATYTYTGKPNPFYPSGTGTFVEPYGFTPPYGDFNGPDTHWPTTEQMIFLAGNYDDGTAIDIDNLCVTHAECPDACCLKDGSCAEGRTQTDCEAANGKYYPNVACTQLGTPGYPPACGVALGSCCNAGPGSGGSCTDGVTEADCTGTQLTWNKGASCAGSSTACNIGGGVCNCGAALGNRTPCPGQCLTIPSGGVCSSDADCNAAGFCYAGTCTPAAVPGHCEYSSKGYCASSATVVMGQCDTLPPCVPSTGVNCCDLSCPAPCPGGEACLPIKQPCDVVPTGADCFLCEGCTAWPTVGCVNLGGSAECPAPAGSAVGPGTCVANPPVSCNVDANCGTGRTCVVPVVNPGGTLCTSDAVCVTPATICGAEHTGACCAGTTGLCRDDVLAADCTGDQEVWSKLTTCAVAGCIRHTGACCDASPKAVHCTDGTYPEDCDNNQNQTWHKGATCQDSPSVCPALTLGACCNTLAGTCTDNETQGSCGDVNPNPNTDQRVFSLDKTCLNAPCAADLGACCDHDTFGSCTDTTVADCTCPKCEWTKLVSCANVTTCIHDAIPTVSEWGLVVLTLLLLVGAKVYFGRRQSAAA
jgi:hypothetical protein